MPPRLCCCGGCPIFTDSFDRADNASLGSNWTEYSSTAFEIYSNRVRAVDGGIAICNVVHPTPSGSMVVAIETVDEHSGDIYDILLNVKDHQNYHRARFYRNSGSTSQIELAIVVGGTPTVLKTETILSITGTARKFTALIADHEFCASVEFGLVSLTYANTTLITGGYYSGIGTPNSSGMLMDNFYFGHHLQTMAGCPSCVCQCDNYYVPPRLNLHLGDGTGRMATLNCDIELKWDRVNQYWEGRSTCCTVDFHFILNCGAGSWDTFSLFNASISCFTPSVPQTWAPTDGHCNPFWLKFGPFIVPSSDLACVCDGHGPFESGSYTIYITELP